MSVTRKPKFGSFGAIQDSAVRSALNQLKEAFEVNLGLRGDALDANPTWRQLVDSGLVIKGRRDFEVSDDLINQGTGGDDPNFDSTTPPAPENVVVEGGFSVIFITWDAPSFENLAYAEVWRSATDDLGTAVKVGNSDSATPFFVDATGVDSGILYYWVRFVSIWGSITGPYNAVAGTPGQSAIDPAYIIDQLSGQITRTELAANLNAELDDIDANGIAIAQEIGVRTNETGELYAQYTVKIDAGGLVSGFGLASEPVNGATVSSFIVHANNFAVGFPGQTDAYPFVIGTVNGLSSIGMNASTFILDLTVTDAKIASLKADKLYVDSGTLAQAIIGQADITNAMIANIIQSNNYVAGSSGWIINKAGSAEFRNILARGDIEATSIKADAANIVSTLNLDGSAVTIPISAYISSSAFTAFPANYSFGIGLGGFSGSRISYGFTTPSDLGASKKLTAFFFGYGDLPNYVVNSAGINASYNEQRFAFYQFDINTGNYQAK